MAIYKADLNIPGNITEESPFERVIKVNKGAIRYIAIRLPRKNDVQIRFLIHMEPFLPKKGWVSAQGWKNLILDSEVELSTQPFEIVMRAVNPDRDSKVCLVVIGDNTETRESFEKYLSRQLYYRWAPESSVFT